jgi:hypothetical protein
MNDRTGSECPIDGSTTIELEFFIKYLSFFFLDNV